LSYIAKVLQPGEHIVHRTGPHWLVYLRALLLLVLAVAAYIAATAGSGDPSLVLRILAAALLLLALIAWFHAFLTRATTELAVTDRRIVFKRGLIRRHTVEMNTAKVESVDVDQSILGRIFGYGTVTVRGTGGSIEPLRGIAGPLAFRSSITAG
jgi:uncharacterized membrane protein YdbT with pleckstrin-like domain